MTHSAGDQIDGAIDELKIFNLPLNHAEIAEAMNTIPGKKNLASFLYVPFEGKIDPRGEASFRTAEAIFTKGKIGMGIKISRHGYDRKTVATLTEIVGMNSRAQSLLLYLLPDWNGEEDTQIHGIFSAQTGSLKYAVAKKSGKALYIKVRENKKPLWALDGAERIATTTREKIILNALWRFDVAANQPDAPLYLAVPERYSGWENGLADAEFRLRDKNLQKLPPHFKIGVKPLYDYTESIFERAL